MSDHSSSSKVILALLAGASMGAIIGAGAALLLSPNDGKTNRKKTQEKINEWTENMHEKSESIIDDIEEELKDIKTEAEAEKNDEKK
jgi:gas vesicle protein